MFEIYKLFCKGDVQRTIKVLFSALEVASSIEAYSSTFKDLLNRLKSNLQSCADPIRFNFAAVGSIIRDS